MKKAKIALALACLVSSFTSTIFAAENAPFAACVDAQENTKIYDFRQTGDNTASLLAQIHGENFSLLCGLSDDMQDVIPIACAGFNGERHVSVRVHRKPESRPRAAVIELRMSGDKSDINAVVPLVCE